MNLTELRAPLSPNARLRYDVVRRILEPLRGARSLLEIGCGQGALAMVLARSYDYVGYEPDASSFALANSRLHRIANGQVVNTALPGEPDRHYDVVAAFEVLEHQPDDVRAVSDWVQWIVPGGHLLLSVPAHPHRFGRWDDYVGHYRRYTRQGLRQLLEEAGLLEITIHAYGFPLGYVLEWARNALKARLIRSESMANRTAASGRRLQPGAAVAPLVWVATLPFVYVQRPFATGNLGTGFVARAKAPT